MERFSAVALGHAIGDAMGVPVEFCSRAQLEREPVTGMRGFGTYAVPAGAWSDDTSMSLCALECLSSRGLDYDGVMNNFSRWYYAGEFTPTGVTFDVGATCRAAIRNYAERRLPPLRCGLQGERANGNGSLMRIYPFVLWLSGTGDALTGDAMEAILAASALTHGHRRAQLGCGIYACVLHALLRQPSEAAVTAGLADAETRFAGEPELAHYRRLFAASFSALPRREIRSSGYVVDTLEAAIWCLLTTGSFAECVCRAVNLGEDTDSVAAVAGSLAGARYGYDGIPQEWLDILLRRDYIESLCYRLERARPMA